MPGERLVCVWQAAYVQDPETVGKPRKAIIQCLTSQFGKSDHINFKPLKFDNHFKEATVDFNDYKAFVIDHLIDKMAPLYEIEEDIERMSWDICKQFYQLDVIRCPENRAFQLWQIFNKLVARTEQPPRISAEDALWLTERLVSALGRTVTAKDLHAAPEGISYGAWLRFLDQNYLRDLPADQLAQCVDEVHGLLVKEISMTGWLQKRTRKQANWTNWNKRWFILTPGKLTYYKEQNLKEQKGEVRVTTHSKIESVADHTKSFRKLRSVFRLTNAPYLEIEMSAGDEKEKKAWLTALRDIIEAARAGTTPVQALLAERATADEKGGAPRATLRDVEEKMKSIRVTPKSVNPAATKAKAAAARQAEKKEKPTLAPIAQASRDSQYSQGSDEEPPESFDNNFLAYQENKMKAVFSKLDCDGNGFITLNEFERFIEGLGVKMTKEEVALVFKTVDANSNGKISLTEFSDYFVDFLTDETGKKRTGNVETRLRNAFLQADRDGTGTVDFKEFVEFAWERKRSVRVSRLLKTFQRMDSEESGEVSFDQFRRFLADQRSSMVSTILEEDEDAASDATSQVTLEDRLKAMYEQVDDEDLAKYLRERWNAFVSFKRTGASGDVVMQGGHGFVADFLPGEYNLVDLACFTDLPPLEPVHRVIKGCQWEKAKAGARSGRIIFPSDFDGVIPTDIATSEHLRYYGCSLADHNQVQVALLYRHAIQDFTYQNAYLADYVTNPTQLGGSGIERHGFSHLDCPMDADSGTFIMAKFVDDAETELHISGFRVPTRHTLYIPPFVIHSNDYLKGTWRTMLSDEADIDHAHLMKQVNGECTHIEFSFK